MYWQMLDCTIPTRWIILILPSLIWTSAKHCPAHTFPAPGWKTFWGLSLSMPRLATCRLSANHEFFYAKVVCTWGIIQCISFLYLPLDSPPAQLQLWSTTGHHQQVTLHLVIKLWTDATYVHTPSLSIPTPTMNSFFSSQVPYLANIWPTSPPLWHFHKRKVWQIVFLKWKYYRG